MSKPSIIRRAKNWVRHPWRSTGRYRRLVRSGLARWQMTRAGLPKVLEQRPASAIPPDWVDLWMLYRTVRRRKPRLVLEFGSGCSTIVLAQALHDNAACGAATGHVYSVDADRQWAEIARQSLPASLKSFCTVSFSNLREEVRHGVPGFAHAEVPAVAPNLLYLDGPVLTPERQVAFDVLDLEGSVPGDFFMIVDGRTEQCQFLERFLKRRYRIQHDDERFQSTFALLS